VKRFFLLQTTYLHESLEGLNSSLAQSDGELLPGVKCTQEWLLREQNLGQFFRLWAIIFAPDMPESQSKARKTRILT